MSNWEYLGITKNELKVYETLLRCGASTISSLSHKAKLNQRSAYDYIERLIFKGLVGQVKVNNKRLFLGLNPEMLSVIIQDEKREIEEKFNELENLIMAPKRDVQLNILPGKASFLKFLRKIDAPAEAIIGSNAKEILDNPNFRFFASRKVKLRHFNKGKIKELHSNASVIVIFFGEHFLIYSIPEEKAFYVKDADFTENMQVYFK